MTAVEDPGCTCCQVHSRPGCQPGAKCPHCGHRNGSHAATSADAVLDGRPASRVTRQVIDLAAKAGLNPDPDPCGVRRGSYRIFLDSGGRRDCLFGGIDVGARTGRILRAYLTHGSWGEEQRYDRVADIRTVLKSWAALANARLGRSSSQADWPTRLTRW